jgi:DNA repair exonuclease SbcCD ATPase subunit
MRILLLALVLVGMFPTVANAQNPRPKRRQAPPALPPALPDRTPATAGQSENQPPPVSETTPAKPEEDPIVRELDKLVKAVGALEQSGKVQAGAALLNALYARQAALESQIAESEKSVRAMRLELADAETRLQNIAGELATMAYASRDEAEAKVRATLNARTERLRADITATEPSLTRKQGELAALTAQIDDLKAKLISAVEPAPGDAPKDETKPPQ